MNKNLKITHFPGFIGHVKELQKRVDFINSFFLRPDERERQNMRLFAIGR